jgi:hypothetical protein
VWQRCKNTVSSAYSALFENASDSPRILQLLEIGKAALAVVQPDVGAKAREVLVLKDSDIEVFGSGGSSGNSSGRHAVTSSS